MAVGSFPRALAATAALLLAGCATDTTAYYTPPPGLTAENAVSILGSKESHFFLQSSEYHLVWAVDGQRVKDSATRWDQPLLVAAGATHRLSIAYGWGGIAGSTDIDFSGRPGSTVIVQGKAVDPDKSARVWLTDAATGKIIGAEQLVALSWSPPPPFPIDTDQIAIKTINRNLVH